MVVDRDDVARAHAGHAGADLDDLADRLMPEHRRQLARHVPAVHVGAARRACEHPADDIAARRRPARRTSSITVESRLGFAPLSCNCGHGDRIDRLRDAALGHQRPHELGGRHVERGVAHRRAGHGEQRAECGADLVRAALLDLDRVAVRQRPVDRRGRARRPRTGCPAAPAASASP